MMRDNTVRGLEVDHMHYTYAWDIRGSDNHTSEFVKRGAYFGEGRLDYLLNLLNSKLKRYTKLSTNSSMNTDLTNAYFLHYPNSVALVFPLESSESMGNCFLPG